MADADVITTQVEAPAQGTVTETTKVDTAGTTQNAEHRTGEWGKFLDQASDPFKRDETFKGMKTLDDVLKGYKDLSAKSKELSDTVSKTVAPKDISGYTIAVGEGFKGTPGADGLLEFYKNTFLENGVPADKAQAQGLWAKVESRIMGALKTQTEAREAERNKAVESLKGAWKGDYETRMTSLAEFGKTWFTPESWAKIEASGLGNDLGFLESLLPVAKAYGEGKIIRGGGTSAKEVPMAKKVFSSPNFK